MHYYYNTEIKYNEIHMKCQCGHRKKTVSAKISKQYRKPSWKDES